MDLYDQSGIIYSPSWGYHGNPFGDQFHLNKSLKEELSLKDVLTQAIEFVKNDIHFSKKIIDDCQGLWCNNKC